VLKARLLELEAELIAKEEAEKLADVTELPPDCELLLEHLEVELSPKLAALVASDWKGFLTYRRTKGELIVCRGRAFKEDRVFGKWKAGLDVPYGLDTMTEYMRGFDVSPPQDLDHLMINFGLGNAVKVFLWYGENISPYRLIFQAEIEDYPQDALTAAISDALGWIVNRPKAVTLPQYLKQLKSGQE